MGLKELFTLDRDENIFEEVLGQLVSWTSSSSEITLKKDSNTVFTSAIVSIFRSVADKYWFKLTRHQKNKVVLYSSLAFTAFYVLSPSILHSNNDSEMFSRQRPDKYTTGLINMDIDCFANSVLQSLLALPGLNEYLNELYHTIYHNPDVIAQFTPPELPLHVALINILSKLQRIVFKSQTLSVWDFLNVLEAIFKSKISRNQHDAHELLQLILETLYQENLQLYKYAIRSGISKTIAIPALPFKSLLLNQLQCTVCGGSSNLNFNPMMILTLPVPQESNVDLANLISTNEKELIEGYSCLKCKINAIINIESQNLSLSAEDLEKLKDLQNKEGLMINDDLDKDIGSLIDNYKNPNGFDIESVKTTIYKRNDITKPPKILPIHLSRSIFTNTQELRNSCQVLFPEELTLTPDEALAAKLEQIEDQKYLSDFYKQDLEPKKDNDYLKPLILTNIDEKQEDSFYEDVGQVSDAEDGHIDSDSLDERSDEDDDDDVDEEAVDDENEDDDNLDPTSESGSPIFKKGFEDTPPTSSTPSNNGKMPQQPVSQVQNSSVDPLQGVPPTVDPNSKVVTTKYKYRLKSMIRHLGTHQAGHYECYRHKPVIYKVDGEQYDVQFPFLASAEGFEDNEGSQAGSEAAVSDSQLTEPESSTTKGRSRSSSMRKSSVSISRVSRQGSIQPLALPEEVQSHSLSRSSSTKKPRRFSRRLSSFLSPTSNSDIEAISELTNDLKLTPALPPKSKRKKLGSFVKYPFWRISDSKVTEVKVTDVLSDNKAVYMLFYERVD